MLKKILFTVLLLTLFFPMIEQGLKITHFAHKLDGTFLGVSKVDISIQNVLNTSYQENREERLKYKLYIKGFFIRFNNQIKYWFFKKLKANGVVEGKDGYLFYSNYIDEYYGFNYTNEETIHNKVLQIKELSDSLKKHNVAFLFVIAPNKGRIMKEYLPSNIKKPRKEENTNYFHYKKEFVANNINYLDINSYFESIYKKTEYPLFAKGGIHWSDYGSYIGLEEIISKMEHVLDTSLITPLRTDVIISKKPKKVDSDIDEVNNLLITSKTYRKEQLAYYTLDVDSSKSNYKPNVLVISDSFYWNLYHNKVPNKLFDKESKFWYYNSSIWPDSENKSKNNSEILNMKAEFYQRAIVILMMTEGNLNSCCFDIKEKIIDKL